jgi:NAD(P)H-hydrate epimerase
MTYLPQVSSNINRTA